METLETLKELTSNILGEMFYLSQETEPLVKNFNYKYAVKIVDNKYDVILMFCDKTAKLMTENFLGDEKFNTTDIHDTLKECVNIIVGNFLGSLYPDAPKKINIPLMIENIESIAIDTYQHTMLFYKEEPLEILLKVL